MDVSACRTELGPTQAVGRRSDPLQKTEREIDPASKSWSAQVGARCIRLGPSRSRNAFGPVSGTCPNAKIIQAETVEARVLEGVRTRLLTPEVIAAAVRAYQEDMEAARREVLSNRAPLERELGPPCIHASCIPC